MKNTFAKKLLFPFCFAPLLGMVSIGSANKTNNVDLNPLISQNMSFLPLPCGFPNKGIVNSSPTTFVPSDFQILEIYRHIPAPMIPPPRAPSTVYSSDGQSYITLQSDGNLVIYGREALGGLIFGVTRRLWDTGTAGLGGVKLFFQYDGNLVLKNIDGGVVWAAGINTTCGNAGAAYFTLQNDSNFVMRYPEENGKAYNLADTNTAKGRTSGWNHRIK